MKRLAGLLLCLLGLLWSGTALAGPGFQPAVKMSTATTGTGTMTLAPAPIPAPGSGLANILTFAQANIRDGDVVNYLIIDGNNFESGTGTYRARGPTLTRVPHRSNNRLPNGTSLAISLSGNAVVYPLTFLTAIDPIADFGCVGDGVTDDRACL